MFEGFGEDSHGSVDCLQFATECSAEDLAPWLSATSW